MGLTTANNDLNTKGRELGKLIWSLSWLSMLQTNSEFVLIQFGFYNPKKETIFLRFLDYKIRIGETQIGF